MLIMSKFQNGLGLMLALTASVYVAASTASADWSPPERSEWPLVGLTAENLHFSPLTSISDKNVEKLGVAWATDIPARAGLAGIPIVVEGVAYLSGQSFGRLCNRCANGNPAVVI